MSIYGTLLHLFLVKKYAVSNRVRILEAIANLKERDKIDKATILSIETINSEIPEEEAVQKILQDIGAL